MRCELTDKHFCIGSLMLIVFSGACIAVSFLTPGNDDWLMPVNSAIPLLFGSLLGLRAGYQWGKEDAGTAPEKR